MPPPASSASIDRESLGQVLSLARRMAGPRSPLLDDFEEAAVDGLLAAGETHHKAAVSFSAWARACARKKILERCRSLRAAKRGGQVAIVALEWEPAVPGDPTFVESFAELVASLDSEGRRLLELRFVRGMNFRTLAGLLGVDERTVRRRVDAALGKLWLRLRVA
jgi:RNA polymerase sigma factor (sigma-70 family)